MLRTICKCARKEKKEWPKPLSMKDFPDSDSNSDEDDENDVGPRTLTVAS